MSEHGVPDSRRNRNRRAAHRLPDGHRPKRDPRFNAHRTKGQPLPRANSVDPAPVVGEGVEDHVEENYAEVSESDL